ncbi:MAG: cupin domain-containing protein [Cyanobacteria bacterium P01_H01_bin.15]
MTIAVNHQPTDADLQAQNVFSWPVWSKEVSTFPWAYDEAETCYFLAGEVIVTPEGGEPVQMGTGDLVIFPAGMSCTWEIKQSVRKHYRFG